MAHDEHVAALSNQFHQGVGGDTGTHLAAVIRLPVASAVEAEVEAVLHHGLIAATAQSHFDTQSRKVVAFLKIHAVHAQTDGDGGLKSRGAGDLVDLFKQ